MTATAPTPELAPPSVAAVADSRAVGRVVELASGLLMLLDEHRITGRLPLDARAQVARLRHAVKLAVQATTTPAPSSRPPTSAGPDPGGALRAWIAAQPWAVGAGPVGWGYLLCFRDPNSGEHRPLRSNGCRGQYAGHDWGKPASSGLLKGRTRVGGGEFASTHWTWPNARSSYGFPDASGLPVCHLAAGRGPLWRGSESACWQGLRRLVGSEQEELGDAPPALLCRVGGDHAGRHSGLAHRDHLQSGALQGLEVAAQRAVGGHKRHRQAVTLHLLGAHRLVQVGAVDDKRCGRRDRGEPPGRGQRVHDRHAQNTAGDQDAADLAHGAVEVVDVLQRHAGHGQVGDAVGQWQRGRVGLDGRRAGGMRGLDKDRSDVDAQHAVAAALQFAAEAPLATAEVDGEPTRRWQQVKQRRPNELPEAVVSRPACPGQPVLGVCLPGVTQGHLGERSRGWVFLAWPVSGSHPDGSEDAAPPGVQQSRRGCAFSDDRAGITTERQESCRGREAQQARLLSWHNARAHRVWASTNSRLLQHWTDDLVRRITRQHRNPHWSGAGRLVQVALAAGLTFELAWVEYPATRSRERRLENQGSAYRRCPLCRGTGGPLDPVAAAAAVGQVGGAR